MLGAVGRPAPTLGAATAQALAITALVHNLTGLCVEVELDALAIAIRRARLVVAAFTLDLFDVPV